MPELRSEILIVGGGAAGLSAAAVAAESSFVRIVDDNPALGGQIWRAERSRIRSKNALELLGSIDDGRVEILNNVSVHGIGPDRCLLADSPDGLLELRYEKLIIATGARELFLPFPGWTLPGVFGAGGLQAMVKGGANVSGKRIVVTGTGPLLLAVADYLRSKGATILAIAEQAPRSRINRFALRLWRSPKKIAQAVALGARLRGIPYLTDCWVTAALGNDSVQEASLFRKGRVLSVECDLIACGYHLVPNVELPQLLGCSLVNGFVTVDQHQTTTIPDVYCAGEPTGIGGVEASLVEGRIAGLAAAERKDDARKLYSDRARTHRFADDLNSAFALRDELKEIAAPDTIVCRCEDVEYRRLSDHTNFRSAKLQTRCGMGPCQGRICGAAAQFIFGWESPSVRPPIFPVKMENL
jgi:NADPH-dependent 2,4-dienoyl-CoA reductase/sulfur reductase-like enzyme